MSDNETDRVATQDVDTSANRRSSLPLPNEQDQRDAFTAESDRIGKTTARFLQQDFEIVDESASIQKTVKYLKSELQGPTARLNTLSDPSEEIFAIFKDKSQAERKAIKDAYKKETGESLETALKRTFLDSYKYDRAVGLLNRSDSGGGDAERINAILKEHSHWISGRSDRTTEKDLIDTISTLNSKQMRELSDQFKQKYKWSFETALKDSTLPQEVKDMLKIYMKGADQITNEDRRNLAETALKTQKLDLFERVFRDAPQEFRREFLQNGGEDKIRTAFAKNDFKHDDNSTRRALDYVKYGKLSASTEVHENTTSSGDNNEGIEKALHKMTDAERQTFLRGRQLAKPGSTEPLNQQDKHALEYFKDLDAALHRAGTSTEVSKWHDMIERKGGSLISQLAEHRRGWFGEKITQVDNVLKTIENMSADDFARLKQDRNFKTQVDEMLKTYLSGDDLRRATELVQKKQRASSFEESQSERRSVIDVLKDTRGEHAGYMTWFTGRLGHNPKAVVDSIVAMPESEQQKYRTNSEYRKEVDALVEKNLYDGPAKDAALRLLNKVAQNEKPVPDVADKINIHRAQGSDAATIVRDLQETLGKDPGLRNRILAGTNSGAKQTDRELSEAFFKAARAALPRGVDISNQFTLGTSAIARLVNPDLVDELVMPILRDGKLPPDVQLKVNTESKGKFEDLAKASPEDRQRMLTDESYRSEVFSNFSRREREVALNVVKQGEMRSEDKFRAALLSEEGSQVKEVLSKLSPQEKQLLRSEYAKKYGDIAVDVSNHLSGQEKRDTLSAIRREGTSRQEFNNVRDDVYDSRDGLGSRLTNIWDGTGYQLDSELNKYSQKMTESARRFQDLPREQQEQLKEQMSAALKGFVDSKGAMADTLIDCTLGAVTLAITGGSSLAVLGMSLAAGAVVKLGAKHALMGADYNPDETVYDLLTGAAGGAVFNVVTIGKLAQLGRLVAAKTATDIAEGAGKSLLKPGCEGTFRRELAQFVKKHATPSVETAQDRMQFQKELRQFAVKFSADQSEAGIQKFMTTVEQRLRINAHDTARGAMKEDLKQIGQAETKQPPKPETRLLPKPESRVSNQLDEATEPAPKVSTEAPEIKYSKPTDVKTPMLEYQKQGTIKATKADEPFEWKSTTGQIMKADKGDWKVIQPDGSLSSIKPDIFEKTYAMVPGKPGEYARTVPTRAQILDQHVEIVTEEGTNFGKPGDYLCTGPKGEQYIVAKDQFEKMFKPKVAGQSESKMVSQAEVKVSAKPEPKLSPAGPEDRVTMTSPENWARIVGLNDKDPYGRSILDFTNKWAAVMEREIKAGRRLEDVVDAAADVADTVGISGFQFSCAQRALVENWVYGKQLQAYFAKKLTGETAERARKGTLPDVPNVSHHKEEMPLALGRRNHRMGHRSREERWQDFTKFGEGANKKLTAADENGYMRLFDAGRHKGELRQIQFDGGIKNIIRNHQYAGDVDKLRPNPTRAEFNKMLAENPRLREAQRLADETPSTHLIDTPERNALRARLREEYAAELIEQYKPRQGREFEIVIGLSGSGKSTVAEEIAKKSQAAAFDVDKLKPRLPEWNNGIGAGAMSQETHMIQNPVLNEALKRGDNIVLPTVGARVENIENLIQKAKDQGYKVKLTFVDIAPSEAMRRIVGRLEKGGMYVDPRYLTSLGNAPRQNFDKLVKELFTDTKNPGIDGFRLIDNAGMKPQIVEHGTIARNPTTRAKLSDIVVSKEKETTDMARPEGGIAQRVGRYQRERGIRKDVSGEGPDAKIVQKLARPAEKIEQPKNWTPHVDSVEPPVPEGHIRLYRGVQPAGFETEFVMPFSKEEQVFWDRALSKGAKREALTEQEAKILDEGVKLRRYANVRYYSPDMKVALDYAGPDGKLVYIDLPSREAMRGWKFAGALPGESGMYFNADVVKVSLKKAIHAREHVKSPTNPRVRRS